MFYVLEHLRRKVHSLWEKVRRREKKIRTLAEALEKCKKCNWLSDEAHDVLTETFSPGQELFLNEVLISIYKCHISKYRERVS